MIIIRRYTLTDQELADAVLKYINNTVNEEYAISNHEICNHKIVGNLDPITGVYSYEVILQEPYSLEPRDD